MSCTDKRPGRPRDEEGKKRRPRAFYARSGARPDTDTYGRPDTEPYGETAEQQKIGEMLVREHARHHDRRRVDGGDECRRICRRRMSRRRPQTSVSVGVAKDAVSGAVEAAVNRSADGAIEVTAKRSAVDAANGALKGAAEGVDDGRVQREHDDVRPFEHHIVRAEQPVEGRFIEHKRHLIRPEGEIRLAKRA
ncbi:MAG: hypothetical protein IMW86_07715 [Hydrogenibacillus sp.]|nr:hypothetical protein [Hydrogenibacillus sp.]